MLTNMHLLIMRNISKTINKNYLLCNHLIAANELCRSSTTSTTSATTSSTSGSLSKDPPNTGWRGIPQYDVSVREQENIKQRNKMRRALKAEFNRLYYHPWKLVAHVELLDPALNRWMAMRASYFEYWKPTWKGFFAWITSTFVPIFVIGYIVKVQRENFEYKCRSGEIPYEARQIKFM